MRATITRILVGRGLRSVADGFMALLLPVHLGRLGYGAVEVGLLQRVGALPAFSDHVHHISPSNCRAESRSGRLLIS